jgi:demethylmenaquinone methyltransferase/2-methoxy-6-polyprenyl-1,4-benzoquinol methylase
MDSKQEYFDSLADDWDKDVTAEDLERLSHIIDQIGIAEGVQVCDLGCGTGVMFDLLRRRVGKTGYIIGVDFAPQVAHKARRNFPFHNIGVVEADASALPFGEKRFDLVVSFAAFAHFSDKSQSIHEAYRILRPGGRLFIIHLLGSAELAMYHHTVGGVVDHDVLPDKTKLAKMFERGQFSRFELTDTRNLYLAIGYKK